MIHTYTVIVAIIWTKLRNNTSQNRKMNHQFRYVICFTDNTISFLNKKRLLSFQENYIYVLKDIFYGFLRWPKRVMRTGLHRSTALQPLQWPKPLLQRQAPPTPRCCWHLLWAVKLRRILSKGEYDLRCCCLLSIIHNINYGWVMGS